MPGKPVVEPEDEKARLARILGHFDPASFAARLGGFTPDPWQRAVMQSVAQNLVLCCCRQSGKSTTAALVALWNALYVPGSLTLLIAPVARQSSELLLKASAFLRQIPNAPKPENESSLQLRFPSGSRLLALPGENADAVRGFSAPRLVVADEAAWISEDLFAVLRPMMSVGQGRFILMSTPNGHDNVFAREWHEGDGWERYTITADQCPRISKEFLAAERKRLTPAKFDQEFYCKFIDASDQVFATGDIEEAIIPQLPALDLVMG